jgi:hypothetical protein
MDGIDIVSSCLGGRDIAVPSQVRQDAGHSALRQVQTIGNLANRIARVVDQMEKDGTVIGEKGPLLVHAPIL